MRIPLSTLRSAFGLNLISSTTLAYLGSGLGLELQVPELGEFFGFCGLHRVCLELPKIFSKCSIRAIITAFRGSQDHRILKGFYKGKP